MSNFMVTLILFSSMEVVSKPLMGVIDPFLLTFYRFVVGFLILFGYLFINGEITTLKKISNLRIIKLLLLGVLNGFVAMSMLQVAVKAGNAATAAVIFCSNPLFVYLFQILLKEEKLSKDKTLGLLLGIAGIVVIMFGKGLAFSTGAIAALIASLTFAFYQVGNKKAVKGLSPFVANAVSFFGCLPAYLIYFFIMQQNLAIPEDVWQFSNLWRFVYLSLFVSALGYITFIKTVKQLSAVSASVIFLLKPAVATLLAIIFLSENPGWNFYIGLALSLLGSLLALNVKWTEIRRIF